MVHRMILTLSEADTSSKSTYKPVRWTTHSTAYLHWDACISALFESSRGILRGESVHLNLRTFTWVPASSMERYMYLASLILSLECLASGGTFPERLPSRPKRWIDRSTGPCMYTHKLSKVPVHGERPCLQWRPLYSADCIKLASKDRQGTEAIRGAAAAWAMETCWMNTPASL